MKNNNKIYTTLLIFVLVFLFLVVFFVWPLLKEIKKNSGDLIFAKEKIATLAAQNTETENFAKDYQTLKPNLDKLDQLFFDQDNPINFIEFLENTVATSQTVSQISLQSSLNESQKFAVFQISSKGSFSAISNLVEALETGPYLIEIENLTISGKEATLSLKVFSK